MTTHKIITGDSRDLSSIPASSVQLIVTSPPYPMISMWDEMFSAQDETIRASLEQGNGNDAFDRMHAILNNTWRECDRVLADGGFVCINIGDAVRTIDGKFALYPNHAEVISYFRSLGYTVLPDIHWRKATNAPNKFMGSGMYPAGAYVTYEHEYILIFRKGDKRVFEQNETELRHKSAYFWEERNTWFSDLWDITGAGQKITAPEAGRARSAAFPFEIPYRLVNMYSIEGDTVLDPFSGLGTTSLACMASQRNSIGVEIDPSIAELSLVGMQDAERKLNIRINGRLNNHKAHMMILTPSALDSCYDNPFHNLPVRTRQEVEIRIDKINEIVRNRNEISCSYIGERQTEHSGGI